MFINNHIFISWVLSLKKIKNHQAGDKVIFLILTQFHFTVHALSEGGFYIYKENCLFQTQTKINEYKLN